MLVKNTGQQGNAIAVYILNNMCLFKKKNKVIVNKAKPENPDELKIVPQAFEMNELETWRYNKFWEKHRECRIKAGEKTSSGFPVGGVITSFFGTGLGWIVHCKCPICGAEEDITDNENW